MRDPGREGSAFQRTAKRSWVLGFQARMEAAIRIGKQAGRLHTSTTIAHRTRAAALTAALVCALLPSWARTAARRQSPAPAAAPETRIEVVALDKDGRVVEQIGPADITVTIDGVARPVLSIGRVSRGPGAVSDAARRQAGGQQGLWFAAEPVRNVVVIVDQAFIVRGDEKMVVEAGRAFLDRLGLGDRAAVVRLPLSADQRLELTTDRQAVRGALSQVRGQAAPSSRAGGDPILPSAERAAVSDPNRLSEAEPPKREPAPAGVGIGAPEAEASRVHGSLASIAEVLRSLQPLPGRKVVVVFSPGFQGVSAQAIANASAAAISADATVYALGLPANQDDPQARPESAALEALARNTGGAFATLGRNAGRTIDQAVGGLSAVYVVCVAAGPSDADGKRHVIRVQIARKDLTLRAPAWLLPAADPQDVRPEADTEPRAPEPADVGAGGRRASVPGAGPGGGRDKDTELALALGRLFEYVQAYESQYSALVAEEDYEQIAGQKSVRLRSDFLLVNQESTEGWVSFRDVFEVDGRPVRDREDRLKRLFLEPGSDGYAQLVRIKEESARYNIGPMDRNINLPLFLLHFLTAENRSRCRYRIAGRVESGDIRTWRIDFTEVARPTIITDRKDRDVPASGYFVVEQGTGAITETVLQLHEFDIATEIDVKFRFDPDLGMWVPGRMRETYRTTRVPPHDPDSVTLRGTAKYSKFRRFQVTTDATITIKKW